MSTALIFRTNLRRALLKARAALGPEEYAAFLEWYGRMRRVELGGHEDGDIGFDYLNGVIDGPIVSLPKEIAWVVARLSFDREALRTYRAAADQLQVHSFRGEFAEVFNNLAAIVERHGESMWSIQLRIALEQRHHGLEAQKGYLEHVRAQFRHGILSYVAYHTSVRNEDRTSWNRFADGIRQASARRKERPLGDYLNYRLLNEWPDGVLGVGNVIRLEQSHSIVDLYETFVNLCQLAVVRTDLQPFLPVLRDSAHSLAGIGDFRLQKIARTRIGIRRGREAPKALAEGRLVAAVKEARSGNLADSDPWSSIYAALAYALAGREPHLARGPFAKLLVRALSVRGSSANDVGELEKLCQNLSGLPAVRGVGSFIRAVYGLSPDSLFRFEAVGLNAPLDGDEDDNGLGTLLQQSTSVEPAATHLAQALAIYCLGDFDAVSDLLRESSDDGVVSTLWRLHDLLRLRTADALGDFAEVVATVSRMGAADRSLIPLLPLMALIGSRPAHAFKALPGALAPLNALNMLWKSADDEAAASTLKLMTGQFLRSRSERRPSLLPDALPPFPSAELVYFLREVCVPNVLDVSRVFKGSKEVIEERQAICSVLHVLDPEHADQYSDEVAAITRRLKVDEGLKIVDQSRIHVDTDAVTRWARRNLREDFERYVDLVEAGIGAGGNFDDAMREVIEAAKNAKQGEFFTPQNEADNTLIRLLSALSDEFLNSSTFGLDYFLSKRIRHVSFIGLVRSPLEFSHLIANKPTAQADYRSNSHWLDRLKTLNDSDRLKVDLAIKTFSKTFDEAVNHLKSDIFHVRSSERPNGIFSIPLSTTVLTLARALLSETGSFEDFLESVYIIFWAILESSLSQARQIIDNELKMETARAMDELKAEIGKYAHDDPAFVELSAAVAKAGSELQAALGEASSWFTRPEIREVMRYFTLEEALDVAIESALKLHRGFTPNFERTVIGDIALSAPDLVFITDAILIAFSNIKAYSRLSAPQVHVALKLDKAAETLTVEIVNEVHSSARSATQDRRISEIRQSIESGGSAKKSRSEGGSGFVKLAAVAHQSSRGCMEFGYIERTRFRLSVTYSILLPLMSAPEAA